MPKRPRYDPADDEPKVGDIWRLDSEVIYAYRWQYYLLLEQYGPDSFAMLCLNSGQTRDIYMNFELDDWRWVA